MLLNRMTDTGNNNAHKQGAFKTYCQAVNYLNEIYATEDAVKEAKVDIMRSKQVGDIFAVRYSKTP